MDQHQESLADDLLIGAKKIALFIYGDDSDDRRRDVYRNPFGFSFFKHGNTVAALKSTIRAELVVAQQAAREERLLRLKEKAERKEAERKQTTAKPLRRQRKALAAESAQSAT
jgi:hypothetical protein